MDEATGAVLREVVRRESRSLLLYVGEAFPWTTAEHAADLARLRELVRAEAAAVAELGKYLVRRRWTPPALGSYPASFTGCNFIDLGHLLPRLLLGQEASIAALTADRGRLGDADARAALERLLAVKQQTWTGLQAILTARAHPAGA